MSARRWVARVVVSLLWAALLVLGGAGAARAQAPIVLHDSAEPRHLGESLAVLVDPGGRETAAELASPAGERRFSPAPLHPNFGFTSAAVWLRFTLENAAADATFVLDTAREWVDEADLYAVSGGEAGPAVRSGATVPIAGRPLRTERIVFPVMLPGGSTRTFLLRLHGRASIALDGEILPLDAFVEGDAWQRVFFGGFFTVLLTMGLYNLLLFAELGDRAPLYLASFLIALGLAEACVHGYVTRLLPSAASFVHLSGASAAFGASALGFYAFSAATLGTAGHTPRLHAVMRWSAIGSVATAALATAVPSLHRITYAGLMVLMPAVLAAAMIRARRGDRAAKVATLAVAAFLAPMSVTGLTLYALLPLVPWMDQGNHLGAIVMTTLLSVTVAEGIRATRERAQALSRSADGLNVELRRKVDELEARGRDVAQLNDELRRQIAGRSRELAEVLATREVTFSSSILAIDSVFDGRYRVVAALGAGGMGAVYEVERASDGRRLALKLITGLASGASAARFAREAEIGATVRHPNVVQILDVGMTADGGPFLVMELVRGTSLEQERPRFGDAAWALPILREAAAGLWAIHEQGIVHRDLKPANVLLEQDAGDPARVRAKIADFGVSRFDAPDPAVELAATLPAPLSPSDAAGPTLPGPPHTPGGRAQLTGTGMLFGTPLYMPPEAVHGRVGTPADVFAFGVMAHEMLSGSPPFATPPVFVALTGAPLPAPAAIAGLPGRLGELLSSCMKASPGDRPSMAAVVAALAAGR